MTDYSNQSHSDREGNTTQSSQESSLDIAPDNYPLSKTLLDVSQNKKPIHPSLLTPNQVIQLQRTIGNHATQHLLKQIQRNPINPIAPAQVLSQAEVARAKRFYESRSHQYPPENVKKFQKQFNVPQTGIIDEAFIQTVASFQQSNGGLVVDGMAGKNTIAEAFPNGMLDYDSPEITASNEELLSNAQVVKALSFYALKPDLYPSAVIKKIQEQVGAIPTGKMNPESVQAVAHFQKNDGSLAVDGMAGPRTMPAAFPTGLSKEKSIEGFAQDTLQLEEEWDSLASESDPAQARAELMLKNANEQLTSANIPPVKLVFGDTKGAKGLFASWMWSIWVEKERYAASAAETDITDLSQIFYHEARHAEQHFSIARLLIGKGHSVEQVIEKASMPKVIVEKAAEIPIIPGTPEAVTAEGWFETNHGKGEKKQDEVLAKMAKVHWEREHARENHKKAKAEHEKHNTPETQKALEEAEKELEEKEKNYAEGRKDYENLPDEADTHRVARKFIKVLKAAREEKANE